MNIQDARLTVTDIINHGQPDWDAWKAQSLADAATAKALWWAVDWLRYWHYNKITYPTSVAGRINSQLVINQIGTLEMLLSQAGMERPE